MPERPHAIGVPSLWERDFWDPIIRACVDTDAVISLHVGSSGMLCSQNAAVLYRHPLPEPVLALG